MQQVPVGRMNLYYLGSRGLGPLGCQGESLHDCRDLRNCQGLRYLETVGKSDGRGRKYRDPTTLFRANWTATFPRLAGTGLSARMSKLDARDRSLTRNEGKQPLQRINVGVAP